MKVSLSHRPSGQWNTRAWCAFAVAGALILTMAHHAVAAGLVGNAVKISDRNNCEGLSAKRLAVKAGVLQLSDAQFRQLLAPVGDSDEVRRHVDCARYIAVNVTSETWAQSAVSGVQVTGDPLGAALETVAQLIDAPTPSQVGGAKAGAAVGAMAGAIWGAATDRGGVLTGIVKGGSVGAVLGGVGGATIAPAINAHRAHETSKRVAALARQEGISLMNEGRLHSMASERAFDQLLGARQRAALSKSDQDRLFAIQVFADGLADRVAQNCRY